MHKLLIDWGAMALLVWANSALEILYAASDQQQSSSDPEWAVPLTEYGQPDLQGLWYFGSATPFERPEEMGDKATYTQEELVAALERLEQREALRHQPLAADRSAPQAGASIGIEAEYDYMVSNTEIVPIDGEYRTSLIISPANGRLPRNPEFKDYYAQLRSQGHRSYDDVKSIAAAERCLIYALAVPSLFPMPWNAHLQIIQTESYVVLHAEMIHDARIIKLRPDAHVDNYPKWLGDSTGYWEGTTLVVDTVNFRPEQSGGSTMPMSEEFKLTERFTPVSENEILYRILVEDPLAFTEPFIIERIIQRTAPDVQMYEFACHEGNYSLAYSLIGARHDDLNLERLLEEPANTHLSNSLIASLSGEWSGEVNGSKLEFRFLPGNNGGLHLFLDLPSFAMRDIVLTDVIGNDSELSFSAQGLGAEFTGVIDGDTISGTWTRQENPQALILTRKP